MDQRTSILVETLAATDAVWLPMRSWSRPGPANRYFARRDFATQGVPWASGGASETARKSAQRGLEAAVEGGLVTIFRPRRIKALWAKLTAEGEAEARRLAGVPARYSAWVSMGELARHSKRPAAAEMMSDVWVSERALLSSPDLGGDELRRELLLVEDLMLPALVAGFVESGSTIRGAVSYAISPRGWRWLDVCDEPSADLDGAYDPEAAALYARTLKDAFAQTRYRTPARTRVKSACCRCRARRPACGWQSALHRRSF